jgi:hypothetical protein
MNWERMSRDVVACLAFICAVTVLPTNAGAVTETCMVEGTDPICWDIRITWSFKADGRRYGLLRLYGNLYELTSVWLLAPSSDLSHRTADRNRRDEREGDTMLIPRSLCSLLLVGSLSVSAYAQSPSCPSAPARLKFQNVPAGKTLSFPSHSKFEFRVAPTPEGCGVTTVITLPRGNRLWLPAGKIYDSPDKSFQNNAARSLSNRSPLAILMAGAAAWILLEGGIAILSWINVPPTQILFSGSLSPLQIRVPNEANALPSLKLS